MNLTAIQNLERFTKPGAGRSSKPAFGQAPAPFLLKSWDFENLGSSNLGQTKFLYTWIILSRWWKARTWNELRENVCRDSLGWYFWFMGSPLMQIGLATLVVPRISPAAKALIISKIPTGKQNPLNRLAQGFLNPYSIWHIASDNQILQRKSQIIAAMEAEARTPASIDKVKRLFETTRMLRTNLMSTTGIAFTIAMIGVGVMFINIALTRGNLRKHRFHSYPSPKQPLPPQSPLVNPHPFKKPEFVPQEYSAA